MTVSINVVSAFLTWLHYSQGTNHKVENSGRSLDSFFADCIATGKLWPSKRDPQRWNLTFRHAYSGTTRRTGVAQFWSVDDVGHEADAWLPRFWPFGLLSKILEWS